MTPFISRAGEIGPSEGTKPSSGFPFLLERLETITRRVLHYVRWSAVLVFLAFGTWIWVLGVMAMYNLIKGALFRG